LKGMGIYISLSVSNILLLIPSSLPPSLPAADESDMCWYSGLRHDGRCRERFDFADHGVLFLSQYLAIQTFEVLAVLREVRREGGREGRVGILADHGVLFLSQGYVDP